MGELRQIGPPQMLLVAAAFSKHLELLDELPALLGARFEPVGLASTRFEFTETGFYTATMGAPLYKQLFAGSRLRPFDELPEIKLATNALEREIAERGGWDVERPINLDPGGVDLGKFMLASTKDHAHRLHLGRGIFGEVTLYVRGGKFEPWPWTYPDYRRPDVNAFLIRAREAYRTLRGLG